MSGEDTAERLLSSVRKHAFAALLAEGLTTPKAADRLGIAHSTGQLWKRDPEVESELRRLRSELRPRLLRRLTNLGDRALDILDASMDLTRETAVPAVALAAANSVLDRIGLSPREIIDHLGHPDEPLTIVVPVPIVGDPRAEQDRRRQEREARIAAMQAPELPPSIRFRDIPEGGEP